MNSSIRWFVSTNSYNWTSVALWVYYYNFILTCVDAKVNAPALFLLFFNFFAISFKFLIDFAIFPVSDESFNYWAYI